MLFVYLFFSIYDSHRCISNRIEDSPLASLLVLVWTKKTLQNSIKQLTMCSTAFPKHLKVRQKCPTARILSAVLSVWKCGETVMGSVYMLDTLHSYAEISKLIQHWILQTWLIPGKLSIFPMIGTLLKKLITTGKNPLKNKLNYKCMIT